MKIPRAQRESLYARLGGYDQLIRVLDGVCARMMRDDRLKIYFRGHNDDRKRRLTQHFANFFCREAGGPFVYGGPDMKTAHRGLQISSDDWKALKEIFRETAEKHKVSPANTADMLRMLDGWQKDVVEK